MENLIKQLVIEIERVKDLKDQIDIHHRYYKDLVEVELVLASSLHDISDSWLCSFQGIEYNIKKEKEDREKIKIGLRTAKESRDNSVYD